MYAVLHVPHFRLQAALRSREIAAGIPLALVDAAEKKSLVLEAGAEAERVRDAGADCGERRVVSCASIGALSLTDERFWRLETLWRGQVDSDVDPGRRVRF